MLGNTLIVLLLSVTAPALHTASAQQQVFQQQQQEQQLLSQLRRDLDVIRTSVFQFWACHGLDNEYGGFLGMLLRDGTPTAPTTKGLVQEARHAWAFSTMHEYGYQSATNSTSNITLAGCIPNSSWPSSQEMAQSAYEFVVAHMQQPASGFYSWNVSRDGNTTTQNTTVLYAQWFIVYSFTKYAGVFNTTSAQQLALKTFRAIDSAWHNSTTGGYNEFANNTFPPDLEAPGVTPLEPWRWYNKTLIPRSLNVMMHGTEALMALHRATRDPVVFARLKEYVEIVCSRLTRVNGLLYEEYEPAVAANQMWRPNRDPKNVVNYGHNLETTWVMIEALDYLTSINATNNTQATQFKSTVLSIGEAAIRAGYDTRHGGVFEKGSPTAVNSTVKVWWIQTESMLAMWKLYRHTSNTTYLQKLVQTAGFVRQHVLDNDYGEFYWQVEANGTYVPSRDLDKGTKGNRWKASYHSARLPLFLERWIQQSP